MEFIKEENEDIKIEETFTIIQENTEEQTAWPVCGTATVAKRRKVDGEGRRFQDKWRLKYFFTKIRNSCVCLICRDTVAVFKEFNIKRHYQSKHGEYDVLTADERNEKLQQLEAELPGPHCFFTKTNESSENATRASYAVAMLIVKHGKPFSDGEFIKDCMMKMVEKVCPEMQQEFASVCLTRTTVVQRIEDVSLDIKRQLEAKAAEFDCISLACDVSADESRLLIFLRGVDKDMNVSEEFLDLRSLTDTTAETDVFVSLCSAVDDMKLQWSKVCGIVTDAERSGLATLVCDKVSEEGGRAVKLHCVIHQEVLFAKHMKYDHVLKPVMNAINRIRSKGHGWFEQFLLDVQAEYGDVVYQDDVRWLNRGSALLRFYSLRHQIRQFFAKSARAMPELSDPVWLADLGFVVDVTRHLNVLSASLQAQNAMVNQLYSHIKASRTKFQLFQKHLSEAQPNTAHFPSLQAIMSSFPHHDFSAQTRRYAADISSLSGEFQQRFQDFSALEQDIAVFSSPFSVDAADAPVRLQLELIDLQCDAECRGRLQQLPRVCFYRRLDQRRFPEIRAFAKRMLSLFGSTSSCEKVVNIAQSCVSSRLGDSHLRDVLHIRTTAFEPELEHILRWRPPR